MARNLGGAVSIGRDAVPVSALPMTFACFFRWNTSGVFDTLMCLAGSNSGRIQMALDTSNKLYAQVQTGGNASIAGTVSSNTWYHGAAVFNTTTDRSIYLDGANKVTSNVSATTPAVTRLRLGARWNGTADADLLNGRLAEAAMWNVALTDAEVASLAKGMKPPLVRPQALVFYAPLVRDVIDLKGGTLTDGGSTVIEHPRVYGA